MPHYAVAKECLFPAPCPVKELVNHHNVAWLYVLPHAPNCRNRYYPFYSEFFHSVDIRPDVEFRREYPVAPSVPRQKDHLHISKFPDYISIGRIPERRLNLNLLDTLKPFHFIEPASSNNSNYHFCHLFSPSIFHVINTYTMLPGLVSKIRNWDLERGCNISFFAPSALPSGLWVSLLSPRLLQVLPL